ncbi:16S rRNA (cytosine(1402)-N(4))-methyltransferase RsmH [Candidatus Peregrinibacteria bacterium]|nr:16S rRNA (cytosine(1402)-N(4))-methyltransferase RsmH [Candidatus Peregrinibacteria bacterium]
MGLNEVSYGHKPVLINTVEKYCGLKKGDTVIDCTLGLGGHSEMFLKHIGAKGWLIAFEQDENNLKIANERLNKNKNKISIYNDNFVLLKTRIDELKLKGADLIFFDLGLASTHVDAPERGFSFQNDGPLDMRFDTRNRLTAEEVLRKYSEKRLEEIFKSYGEERYAKKYAHIIKRALPITRTKQLADLIQRFAPRQKFYGKKKLIHPATRIFQALRIEVNKELEVLEDALRQAIRILKKHGRLIVISYHSLEDRIVKNVMRDAAKECICPREVPKCICNHKPEISILTKKPIQPEEAEIQQNPRSRSAKMRVAEKL